ncbi:hypothetical protein BDV33DRAFT_185845 [Aspergillus novoparasiticus]|uniref:Uncharacterized protein n=1 Tax=Aspergillus novoparasiticus TaxID=986946 RepID=A0A5N6E5T7_9EURO|nr:hypothetical protein BDV33DRAFT_185845 [Aspergillus novoparasiticus]
MTLSQIIFHYCPAIVLDLSSLYFRISRMRFLCFFILQLSALSLASPSQSPADLEERQFLPPIGDGTLQCTAGGQYCCTWEGCQSCCLPYYCKTEIDAAQGYCRF